MNINHDQSRQSLNPFDYKVKSNFLLIENLPLEIIHKIFKMCSFEDFKKIKLVSSSFQYLSVQLLRESSIKIINNFNFILETLVKEKEENLIDQNKKDESIEFNFLINPHPIKQFQSILNKIVGIKEKNEFLTITEKAKNEISTAQNITEVFSIIKNANKEIKLKLKNLEKLNNLDGLSNSLSLGGFEIAMIVNHISLLKLDNLSSVSIDKAIKDIKS